MYIIYYILRFEHLTLLVCTYYTLLTEIIYYVDSCLRGMTESSRTNPHLTPSYTLQTHTPRWSWVRRRIGIQIITVR